MGARQETTRPQSHLEGARLPDGQVGQGLAVEEDIAAHQALPEHGQRGAVLLTAGRQPLLPQLPHARPRQSRGSAGLCLVGAFHDKSQRSGKLAPYISDLDKTLMRGNFEAQNRSVNYSLNRQTVMETQPRAFRLP